jgi:hypothetical protein
MVKNQRWILLKNRNVVFNEIGKVKEWQKINII